MAAKLTQSAEPLAGKVVNITTAGDATIVSRPPGPPKRIDGYSFGVIPDLANSAPHRGEMHPDGDELLFLVSGAVEVIFDDGDADTIGAETTVLLRGGEAIVVPRGIWHQIRVIEPAYFVHLTPGPNGNARPL